MVLTHPEYVQTDLIRVFDLFEQIAQAIRRVHRDAGLVHRRREAVHSYFHLQHAQHVLPRNCSWGDATRYQSRRKTGAAAAITARACKPRTSSACRGARGSHMSAKSPITGICPAIRSCQRCAAAPSSAWRAMPETAMCAAITASAAHDIINGMSAVGCRSVEVIQRFPHASAAAAAEAHRRAR